MNILLFMSSGLDTPGPSWHLYTALIEDLVSYGHKVHLIESHAEDFLYVSEGCLSKSRSYLGNFRGYEAKGDRARRSGCQNYGYPGLV